MLDDNRPPPDPAWVDEVAGDVPREDEPEADVEALLDKVKQGKGKGAWRPKATALNVHRILSLDTRWVGRIRYNAFTSQHLLDGKPMTDERETGVALWLARVYRLDVATGVVGEQIRFLASENAFHPVREYLEGLVWDGVPRLDTYLSRLCQAADTPLTAALGRCFLVSCVARIYCPGCKVDTTLILVGRQGARKSSFLRELAVKSEWFSDSPLDLGSKDLFEALQGKWIIEIAELDAFRGRDWSRIKAVITSATDTWRRPYGRNSVQIDRQVVLTGSTNEDEFLGDPSGSRRFWPVGVGRIDVDALGRERDQLWAEAVVRYKKGTPWHLTERLEEDLRAASAEYQQTDAWDEPIRSYVMARTAITVAEVLGEALRKKACDWSNGDMQRAARVLKRLGFSKCRRTTMGREIVWQRSNSMDL